MNLKKYTKAELISKINGLNSKQLDLLNSNSTNYSNNTTFFQIILKTILYFKSIILKITFIAFLIKIFKKYSLIRRLWTFANYSLMSIFGISFVDIYGTEYLNSLLSYIRDTQVYTWFSGLLGNNNAEIPSRLNKPNKTSTGIEKDTTIAERFKQIINKEPDIIKEEDTPFYKDKNTYIKGAILLFILGLGWYYWEDLQPIPATIFEKLLSFRRRPGSDPGNINDGLQSNTSWNIKEKFKGWWNKGRLDKDAPGTHWTTPSQNNTPIELDSPTRNNLLVHDSPPRTNLIEQTERGVILDGEINRRLLNQISGDRAIKFEEEASIVLGQITNFLDKSDNFPNSDLKVGMYNTIRGKLLALSALTPILYENLIKDDSIYNEIQKFVKLENQINPVDNQSDTYEEVALATVEEQEVWSDRGSSPRVLSPINKINLIDEEKIAKPKTGFASLFDSINKLRNDTDVIEATKDDSSDSDVYKFSVNNADRAQVKPMQTESGLNLLTNLIQEANNFDDTDLLTAVRDSFEEKVETANNSPQQDVDNPEIKINDGSNSDNSMDTYFPEPVKSPQDSKLSPILSQININTEEFIEGSSKDRPAFLNAIKSMRKEYGTPIIETKDLYSQDNSSFTNILDDTNNLLETDLSKDEESSQDDLINPWSNVKVNYSNGTVADRFVNFDFGNLAKEISKILIYTNDGRSNYFDPHNKNGTQTIKWDNLGITNPDSKNLDIASIFIIDNIKRKSHKIFTNPAVIYLDSWDKNIGRS